MLRIIYAGSPEAAAQPLKDIAQSPRHALCGVITNPPAAQKRGRELLPTPVALAAQGLGVPVFAPAKLAEIHEQIAALKPDVLVCFAYGKIFKPEFLALFPQGGINLHPSLLPRYRGCAPVPAAILNGDSETGITVQRMAAQMDAGNILLQTRIALDGTETAESLLAQVSAQGGELLLQVLDAMESGELRETAQDSAQATYCGMLKKEDGRINWNDSAESISAKIRAFCPWPLSFTENGGATLLVHKAFEFKQELGGELAALAQNAKAGTVLGTDKRGGILVQTGRGILAVQNLQWKAKKAMGWKDFMNGSRNFVGSICE